MSSTDQIPHCWQTWRRIKESNHQPFGGAVFRTVCLP